MSLVLISITSTIAVLFTHETWDAPRWCLDSFGLVTGPEHSPVLEGTDWGFGLSQVIGVLSGFLLNVMGYESGCPDVWAMRPEFDAVVFWVIPDAVVFLGAFLIKTYCLKKLFLSSNTFCISMRQRIKAL